MQKRKATENQSTPSGPSSPIERTPPVTASRHEVPTNQQPTNSERSPMKYTKETARKRVITPPRVVSKKHEKKSKLVKAPWK